MPIDTGRLAACRAWFEQLYEGGTPAAYRFRYGLLAFDLLIIVFIVSTSFIRDEPAVETADIIFGILILLDFSARLFIAHRRWRDLMHFSTIADIAAIVSFLAPNCRHHARFAAFS